jgi:hypothetical protein
MASEGSLPERAASMRATCQSTHQRPGKGLGPERTQVRSRDVHPARCDSMSYTLEMQIVKRRGTGRPGSFISAWDMHAWIEPALRAAVRLSTSSMSTHTKTSGSSSRSLIVSNSLLTSLPLSENHLEKRECALTSTSCWTRRVWRR